LSAIHHHVYEKQTMTMEGLLKTLASNFENDPVTHQLLLNKTPRYGNDDDRADDIMLKVFNAFHDEVTGRPTVTGGKYIIEMLPTTCHVYFGSVIGATADGRKAGMPLSEGISPVQGTDRKGPTAVIKSASKMDHLRTGGTLLNQKFTPQIVAGEEGLGHMKDLVRAYFKLDGHHIQFNVVSADTLKAAQLQPDKYNNLIVRVAGYSDYFNNLDKSLQDEIIARTEHHEF
jgi:formate C-acetyltransferase